MHEDIHNIIHNSYSKIQIFKLFIADKLMIIIGTVTMYNHAEITVSRECLYNTVTLIIASKISKICHYV